MKSVKSFFLLVGVLTVILIVFFFRINSDGVFVGGSGGGRHGHSHNSVKVVNMNVFSDALREVLKKSPDSIEKILTKVSELTQGNRPDSATSVEIQNGSGSKSDKYVILNEDNKNENKNGGDIKNHVDDGGVKETANKHEKLNKEAEKGKVAVDNSDNNKQKQQLVDANASEDGKAVIAKKESKEDASSPDTNKKPLCSEQGSKLVGSLFIDQSIPKDMAAVEKDLSVEYGGTVEKGGRWEPTTCTPRKKVAVIIPYRKRFEQLKIFLRHLHPFLQRQELLYRIVVVEQLHEDPFNRAALFNIGFTEALKLNSGFDCFIFTDVDLLPENDHNYYGCPNSPRHMSNAVDKFNYKLPYASIFGGVGAFTKSDFETINGFSNMFWGWGGEDDDLYARITKKGFKLRRPPLQIGRYTMIRIHHFQSSKADPNRMNLLRNSGQRMEGDGLNTLKYNVEKVDELPLVTFVRVQLKRNMYV